MGEGFAIAVKIEIERCEKRGGKPAWQSSHVRTSTDSDHSKNEKTGAVAKREGLRCEKSEGVLVGESGRETGNCGGAGRQGI